MLLPECEKTCGPFFVFTWFYGSNSSFFRYFSHVFHSNDGRAGKVCDETFFGFHSKNKAPGLKAHLKAPGVIFFRKDQKNLFPP